MTDRGWLRGELGSAAVFAIPTGVLTMAGARHVAYYGEPWPLYVLSVSYLWGPAPVLALAVLLQSRSTSARLGWQMSVVAIVVMSLWSVLSLWSFNRQGDVHWALWAMWSAAALGTAFAIASAVALVPSRRLARATLR